MILKGDCIEVMKAMKPNSVDAIVTDPPYGLGFMNKDWDTFNPKYQEKMRTREAKRKPRKDGRKATGFQESCYAGSYDLSLKGNKKYQQDMRLWLTEAYRVLKPGGSMLVMGGTRTSHRLACAIEDSGFIIKDTLMWLYGSGFPKAQDLGKMIDKRNGRNIDLHKEVGRYLKKKREEKGIGIKEVNKIFGYVAGSNHWESQDDNNARLPNLKDWFKLKEILNLDDRFDKLIEREEAVREKTGEHTAKDFSHHNGSMMSKENTPNQSTKIKTIDITNPTTDLAKHWDGFKVGGIKPAYEPILWAVKPPEGNYVDNVLKWGVGAVNVDECRVKGNTNDNFHRPVNFTNIHEGYDRPWRHTETGEKRERQSRDDSEQKAQQLGRFPANVILSHHPECVQVGAKRVKGIKGGCTEFGGMFGNKGKVTSSQKDHADKDGFETVESWDCHPDCAVRLLDEQSGNIKGFSRPNVRNKQYDTNQDINFGGGQVSAQYPDNGGASRFFYCAKASRGERNAGLEGMEKKECFNLGHKDNPGRKAPKKSYPRQNNHPTVKPIKLFEYLIKLVTREGQIILDPFIGSGTTAIAAHNVGRKCVGIEKEDEYLTIAKRRIDYWENQPQQLALGDKNGSI